MAIHLRRRSKYNAQPTVVDNIRFDSKKEARRYGELKLLEKAGQITSLTCHPDFELLAADGMHGVYVGLYVADFEYIDGLSGARMVEDVKSPATRTALYRLKKKLAEACHGIRIVEV